MRKKLTCYIVNLFLSILFLGMVSGGPVYAAEAPEQKTAAFADVPDGFWGRPAITTWSNYGIIRGDGVNFNPNGKITRAEMAVILGRIFGYGKTTDNPYSDIKPDAWYYDALIKAYAEGVMQGSFDGGGNRLARPNDPLTRAEAAVLFARVFSIEGNTGGQPGFRDTDIPEWAKEAVCSMEASGYIKGKGSGLFDPSGNLTRAEAVQILDNIVKLYVYQPGSYSTGINGNVVINTPDAVLQNMKVTGSLYLSEGIGDGNITLDNVTVTGSVFVRGGGVGKIKIERCQIGKLVIEKEGIELDGPPEETRPESVPTGNTDGAGGSGATGDTGSPGGSGGNAGTEGSGDTGDPGGSDDPGNPGGTDDPGNPGGTDDPGNPDTPGGPDEDNQGPDGGDTGDF